MLKIKDYKANTVDPDEMAHYEPSHLSHLDLQCLQIQLLLCLALYGLKCKLRQKSFWCIQNIPTSFTLFSVRVLLDSGSIRN